MSNFPGSNWWSFDFHNHTPASSDFDATTRTSMSPRAWLLAYMGAGIDCVAITDHNSGDWIERLQQELISMERDSVSIPTYRPMKLFPGIELTASDGLHILGIYGPDDNVAKVHGLKTLAKCVDRPNNGESMCTEGSPAICDHIRATGGVVVLAHAEEINGIFFGSTSVSTGGFVAKRGAREIEQVLARCDAIEVHDMSHAAVTHFASSVKDRALVDGSDAHSPSRAGARKVWIKMAAPSIEGLRLALLDPTSSVLRSSAAGGGVPPSPPRKRITALSIKEILLRRPVLEAKFSPWFNAVIGGRGSGKSTLLEALRLTLARESELDELGADSDVLRGFTRFRQVGGLRGSAGMLRAGTELAVTLERHDGSVAETYSFKWTPSSFEALRLDDSGCWTPTGLSLEQASAHFPVRIFSQKQIFEIADRPTALLTYIDSAPEVGYEQWQTNFQRLRGELRALRGEERDLRQVISKKPQFETELKEVSRKTQAYQQSNVAEKVKVFRENQNARKTIEKYLETATSPISALEIAVPALNPFNGLQLGQIILQNTNDAAVRAEADALKNELVAKYASMRESVVALRERVSDFSRKTPVTSFLSQVDAAMATYRADVEKLRSEGVGTAQEAEAALKRQGEIEAELEKIAISETQLEATLARIRKAYAALKRHRRKLTKSRQEFVNSVLGADALLRISIDGQSDTEESVTEFRNVLRLQDGTFVEDIYSNDELHGPSGLIGKLVSPALHDPTHKRVTSLKIGIVERHREILGQALHGKLVTALARLTVDDADALIEWFPQDKVRVEFRRSSTGGYQSLERASAGQKTSAILSFILAHGDEPLVLDQPEDDLDNALVSELVVQQIRTNKSRRQIIVVTHNPNIVVNGDAELVLPMSFEGGQIQINEPGGLQERLVRERICAVMEGGREAFRQRYKRILEDLDATR